MYFSVPLESCECEKHLSTGFAFIQAIQSAVLLLVHFLMTTVVGDISTRSAAMHSHLVLPPYMQFELSILIQSLMTYVAIEARTISHVLMIHKLSFKICTAVWTFEDVAYAWRRPS